MRTGLGNERGRAGRQGRAESKLPAGGNFWRRRDGRDASITVRNGHREELKQSEESGRCDLRLHVGVSVRGGFKLGAAIVRTIGLLLRIRGAFEESEIGDVLPGAMRGEGHPQHQ